MGWCSCCLLSSHESGFIYWSSMSPSRLCSRDGKICCYGDALSTIFLLAFVPCFLLYVFRFSFLSFLIFFSCIPVCLHSSCPFVCAAAICDSQQVRITSIIRVLSACVICTLPHLGILWFFFIRLVYFFVALISRVTFFFYCALVPGTLALDLPTLILKRLVFLCLTVTTEFVSL